MNGIRKQLLAIFAGEEPDYERAAALGPAALPALQAMVYDASRLASKAVYAVALIGAHESLAILAGAARSDDSRLRMHTASALGEFVVRTRSAGDREAASEILTPLLEDENATVRRFARRAVASLPVRPAAPWR